jgi:hypothetical protein
MSKAKLLKYSISPSGKKIATFEIYLPKVLLAEYNTHSLIARNFSSSRAIPVGRNNEIESFYPSYFGKNQSGMVAKDEEIEDVASASELWEMAISSSKYYSKKLSDLGLHKQWANRLNDWHTMAKGVTTATEWNNFLWLRNSDDAQPEIRELAEQIEYLLKTEQPFKLSPGEWHLPYIDVERFTLSGELCYFDPMTGDSLDLETAKMISMARCAAVSYRTENIGIEKAQDIYAKLFSGSKVHCFDSQTEVLTSGGFKFFRDVTPDDLLASVDNTDGKFIGFEKPAELIASDYTGKMYKYSQKEYDACITPNHKIYGAILSKNEDRGNYDSKALSLFEACGVDYERMPKSPKTNGEREHVVPLTTNGAKNLGTNEDFILGQLHGFFIGDGSTKNSGNKIKFHFRKERKLGYISNVLSGLGIDFSIREAPVAYENSNHTTEYHVTVNDTALGKEFHNIFYDCDGNKVMAPDTFSRSQEYMRGVFDGLKNSDGSVKRDTIVYSTSSKKLAEQFEILCAVGGFGSCYWHSKEKESSATNYRLMVRTRKYAKVSPQRTDKPTSSFDIIDYSGKIYCASVSGKVLIVKRNGKTYLSGNSSPAMHQATPMLEWKTFDQNVLYMQATEGVTHIDKKGRCWSGNLQGWVQQRQLLPNHYTEG